MPYNGSGIFARVRSWVADAAAGLAMLPNLMDQDANDIAAGLSNCITRDGQGRPTADIPWAGHGITGLRAPANAGDVLSLGTTPASEVTRALGYTPAINYSAPTHSIGFAWDGTNIIPDVDGNSGLGVLWGQTNLNAGQLNNIAGQALYGTGNLSAGQIGAILGYTPGRYTTPFAASSGGAGDLPANASEVVTAVAFTATGTSAFIVGNASVYNNSGGGAIEVQISIDLFDNTANAEVGGGVPGYCNVTYGQGFSCLSCQMITGGLTPGHTYTARLNMAKGSTAGVTPFSNAVIGGFCS